MRVVFFPRYHIGACCDECSNGAQGTLFHSNVKSTEAAPGARYEAFRLVSSQEVDYQTATTGSLDSPAFWLLCGDRGGSGITSTHFVTCNMSTSGCHVDWKVALVVAERMLWPQATKGMTDAFDVAVRDCYKQLVDTWWQRLSASKTSIHWIR